MAGLLSSADSSLLMQKEILESCNDEIDDTKTTIETGAIVAERELNIIHFFQSLSWIHLSLSFGDQSICDPELERSP